MSAERLRVVLVTGLSGGGKASVLRALEDVGYEAVDNPPLPMLEDMVTRSERKLAIGVDARTRGFDATLVLQTLERLRANRRCGRNWSTPGRTKRRCCAAITETQRRHPLAPQGRVADGIAQEEQLTAPLRERGGPGDRHLGTAAGSLRRLIERQFGAGSDAEESRLVVSLISFAYKLGLPREADLVFDARFLRNPHYDPILQPRTGLDAAVGAFVEADPDFATFFDKLAGSDRHALAEICPGGQEICYDHDWVYRWTAPLGLSGRKTAGHLADPDRRRRGHPVIRASVGGCT